MRIAIKTEYGLPRVVDVYSITPYALDVSGVRVRFLGATLPQVPYSNGKLRELYFYKTKANLDEILDEVFDTGKVRIEVPILYDSYENLHVAILKDFE